MSPDPNPKTSGARRRFVAAIVLFGAWVIGLAVLSSTTAERARPAGPPAEARP